MEAPHYNTDGSKKGVVELPDAIFGVPENPDLVHQVVTALSANRRTSVAHTKDRSEISGGGKKPWRQKGTGNARHGSIRSPLWRGGGATFGPRNERSFAKRVPRTMRAKALAAVLSAKYDRGLLAFADAPEVTEPKTAVARSFLGAIAQAAGLDGAPAHPRRSVCVIVPDYQPVLGKSFRNIGSVRFVEARDVSALDLVTYRYVIVCNPEETIPVLAQRVHRRREAAQA